MAFWLAKSEPTVYSIDDLKRDKRTEWGGVRNYQARNNLRAMMKGDLVLFYHSNAEPPGVAGLCRVSKIDLPDRDQFDKKSAYFDEKATKEAPRWWSPEVEFVERFTHYVSLDELRSEKSLSDFELLRRGSRLSVLPVTRAQIERILELAESIWRFDARQSGN